MTTPSSPPIRFIEEDRGLTVRFVVASLCDASATLCDDALAVSLTTARDMIDEAERALARLTNDPWEPTLEPLRTAREVLSSHLLAAAVCTDADTAPLITARVLRRGADAARHVLSNWRADAGAPLAD